MAERPRRWKRLALNSTLVLASVALALVVVNLALILTKTPVHGPVWEARGLFRLDPDLIYSPVPGERRVWRTEEFEEQASLNSRGLRGAEVRERSEIEARIVVAGDSVVFGHGVSDEQAFPRQMETIYAAEGRAVEVLNAGVKGYGTDQSFKYFERRLRELRPDVLVFALNPNDVADNLRQPLYTVKDGRLLGLDATHTPFYRVLWLDTHLPSPLRKTKFYGRLVSRLLRADWDRTLPAGSPQQLNAWSRQKVVLELEALRDQAREAGFRLVALGVPSAAPHAFRWLRPNLPEGVDFVDANEAEDWGSEPSRWFLNDRTHLTAAGNERLARLLHAHLLDTASRPAAP
jgi:lysophospholipase L1-like esterase